MSCSRSNRCDTYFGNSHSYWKLAEQHHQGHPKDLNEQDCAYNGQLAIDLATVCWGVDHQVTQEWVAVRQEWSAELQKKVLPWELKYPEA